MAIPALVILPLGILFLLSGLIVNFIQALFFILVRPCSRNMYRRINKAVAELLWLQLVWLFDWWANMKVVLFVDSHDFQLMGKEHALLLPNHRSDIDWLVGMILAQRAGCLGSSLAIAKKSSKYLPILGWCMWFSDYIFVERCWEKDENTLKLGFEQLKDFPQPFWLGLFVEGTRLTQSKLLAAQEHARTVGLPIPKNVLVPRTKGFISAVNHMRSFVPAIYDITVTIPKDEPQPTMLRIFSGLSSVVHVHIKRHLMEELPETNSDIARWCKNMFVAKDALLEQHLVKHTFGDKDFQDVGRPKTSFFVIMFWSCLLVYGGCQFFKWLTIFLPRWEVFAICAVFLVIIASVMQIFIEFSQSERSDAPSDPSRNSLRQNLLLPQ